MYVPDHGYEWVESVVVHDMDSGETCEGKGPYLMERQDSQMENAYKPFEVKPALYTEVANLYHTPFPHLRDPILEIANKYGWLGIRDSVTRDGDCGKLESGESIHEWGKTIGEIWELIQVSQWVRNKKLKALGRCVEWSSDNSQYAFHFVSDKSLIHHVHCEPSRRKLFSRRGTFRREENPVLFEKWEREESGYMSVGGRIRPVLGPAKLYLVSRINRHLLKKANPALLIDENGDLKKTFYVPRLLDAIWIGFYEAVQQPNGIKQCAVCGQWMDMAGSRSTKRMHSRCAHRKHQQKYLQRLRMLESQQP